MRLPAEGFRVYIRISDRVICRVFIGSIYVYIYIYIRFRVYIGLGEFGLNSTAQSSAFL